MQTIAANDFSLTTTKCRWVRLRTAETVLVVINTTFDELPKDFTASLYYVIVTIIAKSACWSILAWKQQLGPCLVTGWNRVPSTFTTFGCPGSIWSICKMTPGHSVPSLRAGHGLLCLTFLSHVVKGYDQPLKKGLGAANNTWEPTDAMAFWSSVPTCRNVEDDKSTNVQSLKGSQAQNLVYIVAKRSLLSMSETSQDPTHYKTELQHYNSISIFLERLSNSLTHTRLLMHIHEFVDTPGNFCIHRSFFGKNHWAAWRYGACQRSSSRQHWAFPPEPKDWEIMYTPKQNGMCLVDFSSLNSVISKWMIHCI